MNERPLRIYWAGDRAFSAGTRWHDLEAVRLLATRTGWEIRHPFPAVGKALAMTKASPYGSRGVVRETCLGLLRDCDVMVAYVGSYDTGTAQELEFSVAHRIPILAWSDTALVRGEISTGGRLASISSDDFTALAVPVVPLNAMTTAFDLYIEDSRLDTPGMSPETLSRWIEENIRTLLKERQTLDPKSET